MALGQSLPAHSAKAWAAVPSTISAWQSISPTNNLAHAGSMFMLSVMASDYDYWTENGNTGSSADTCSYAWSTDSGSVSGSIYVSWTLAADAKGLCKCEVLVDDVGSVYSPDTGNRSDDPVTLTKQVEVPTSDIAITTCASTAAGLHEIQYTTTTYAATQQSLVLEYRENNPPYVTEWAQITGTPSLESTTTDAHNVATKTYKMMWNTLPLHNSHYEVRLRAVYIWGCHNETVNRETTIRGVDVNNLNISGSSPDYLTWTPGVSPQAISATLSDGLNLTDTTVTIKIYNSNRTTYPNPLRTRTSTASSPNVSYLWDGKNDAGVDCPAGVYIYTISASHFQTGGEDKISDTSSSGQITALDTTMADDGYLELRSTCNTIVANGRFVTLRPDLTLHYDKLSYTPFGPYSTLTSVGNLSNLPNSNMSGDYICLLTGYDHGALTTDKSHQLRKVLGRTANETKWAVNVYSGPIEYPGQDDLEGVPQLCNKWLSVTGQVSKTGNRGHMLAKGWHETSSSSYELNAYGPNAQVVSPAIALAGLTNGQPVGVVQTTNPSGFSKIPPAVWVIHGHGVNINNVHHILCNDSPTEPFLTSTMINNATFTSSASPYRLAVVVSCNGDSITNHTADELHNDSWTVIYSSDRIRGQVFYDYSMEFVPIWKSTTYKCDLTPTTIATIHSDVKDTLATKPYDANWDAECRADVQKLQLTY